MLEQDRQSSTQRRQAGLRIREAHGSAEYPRLVDIWRSAVEATHDFLPVEDRALIQDQLATAYFPKVQLIIAERAGRAGGFAGVAGSSLEMLFVESEARGTGVGSLLIRHVVDSCGVQTVDVNEQNGAAVGFYRHRGFVTVSRSELDDAGRPYPMLHMSCTTPAPRPAAASVESKWCS